MGPLLFIAMVAGSFLVLLIVADPKIRNLLTPGLGDGMAGPRPEPEKPAVEPVPGEAKAASRSIVPIMDLTHWGALDRGPKCQACRSNLVVGTTLFRMPVASFNSEMGELERVSESGPELLEWIRRQTDRDPGRDPHVVVRFELCGTCHTGWLDIRFMVPTWAGFEGDPSQEQIVTLPPSVTEALRQ